MLHIWLSVRSYISNDKTVSEGHNLLVGADYSSRHCHKVYERMVPTLTQVPVSAIAVLTRDCGPEPLSAEGFDS